ncbi:MAG: hypothetical protein PUB87_04770 [Eubacteriaceae bacterium]|nr:hypothetical protein [Eubacteriaceae bacterium]
MRILEEEIREQENNIIMATRRLERAPEGSLRMRHRCKKDSYYWVLYSRDNQMRKENNITSDKDMIGSLLRKKAGEILLETSENNLKALKLLAERYVANDYSTIVQSLSESYGEANDMLHRNGIGYQNQYLYRPSTHVHETKSGVFVRSKSEVIIANTLTAYGIPFYYEERFGATTAGGKTIFPDFVIVLPDGSKIIWEHLGLLGKMSYCNSVAEKLNTYYENGYILGKNLILTSDDNYGNCSSRQIDEIIRTHILPLMGY